MQPKIVIIGAGLVGSAVADEITVRGWTEVTVLDRGPLWATSAMPGVLVQSGGLPGLAELGSYTTGKFGLLEHSDGPVFRPTGGLEIAASNTRMTELSRRSEAARVAGLTATLLEPQDCAALHPLVDADRIEGGLHTPSDGVLDTQRATEVLSRAAMSRGATFLPYKEAVAILGEAGQVTGVRTHDEIVEADIVICAAGMGTTQLAATVGLAVPLLPATHRFTTFGSVRPVPGSVPVLRPQDHGVYLDQHLDRIGLGVLGDVAPSAWEEMTTLLPALARVTVGEMRQGMFATSPDGLPIVGPHRELDGLWVAESVWPTYSLGVADLVARWIVEDTAPPVTDYGVDRFTTNVRA